MRKAAGWLGVLCALLVAGAVEAREGGRHSKDLSTLKRFPRSLCLTEELTVTPSDDELVWRVGEVREVWCSVVDVDQSSLTSDDLTILKNSDPLPHQTVNKTTIQVTLNLTQPESYKLYCKGNNHVCISDVSVGYEPLEVEDLQCVSHNWETFICNWTLPYNPVQEAKDDYQAYLISFGDPVLCTCFESDLLGDGCTCPETCCSWTGTDYFAVVPEVVVMFHAENKLGKATFNYTIDNYAVVLPNPMKEVTVQAVAGKREARVEWELPAPMSTFASDAAGVVVRVDHRMTDDGGGERGEWVKGEVIECHVDCKTGQQVVLFEHWWHRYEVRVRLRSAAAPQPVEEDGWWSDWEPRHVNTSAAAPDAPPGVGPGTFQVTDRGLVGLSDLTLTWQTLPTLLHNGPDFGYLAQLWEDGEQGSQMLKEVAVTDNFAVFLNVSSSASYRLQVSAHNSEGGGPWAAVRVAEAVARPVPPLLPVVVQHAVGGQEDALYELRWAPGVWETCTVYLCTGEKDPCKGQLYWASAGNSSTANFTLRDFGLEGVEPMQVSFAVSAENNANDSSGLSWDSCGAPQAYNNEFGAPDPDKPMPSSSSVQLPWTLMCRFWAGVVEEAEATCCRGVHASPDNCTEKPVLGRGQPWTGAVQVAGLSAGEEYTAWLRLHYRSGVSPWTDGQTFTTISSGAEVWLIVVVAGIVVLTTVLFVFGVVYSKRKFVDNLKKLRLKPSLPSGLVPAGRQQDGGVGGESVSVSQTTVSASVKNPSYAHILPGVFGGRPTLSLEDQGEEVSFGRGVTQGGRLTSQQHDTDDMNTATGRSSPAEGLVLSSGSPEHRAASPSTSDPLLKKSNTLNYSSLYFSESEGEGRDIYTKPLFPRGYVGLSGPGSDGRGGGSQSTGSWSAGNTSGSGGSSYVPLSECKFPGLSDTPVSAGYVTAQHGEHLATESPGYVQADAIHLVIPGDTKPFRESEYVSVDFPMINQGLPDKEGTRDIHDPVTASEDFPASIHDPEEGSDTNNPAESGWYVNADFPMVNQVPHEPEDTKYVIQDPVATSTDSSALRHDSAESIPPKVSFKDFVDSGDKEKQNPGYVSLPEKDSFPLTASRKGDVDGEEKKKQVEYPSYVSLPDAQLTMKGLLGNHTSNDDKLDLKGIEVHEKPLCPINDAPGPGYIAVQPPEFGKPVEVNTERKAEESTGHYHNPDFLSSLFSKPSPALRDTPCNLVSPVLPVDFPDALGDLCEAHNRDISPSAGKTSVEGYVPLSVVGADENEKGDSRSVKSWFSSPVSPSAAYVPPEAPLAGISFVILDSNPSRTSSVSSGAEIKETIFDSGVVEGEERVSGEEAGNVRAENENLTIDGLPAGYSRVGEPNDSK